MKSDNQSLRMKILQFICAYAMEKNGPTPSIREISHYFNVAYATAYYHVKLLISEGQLAYEDFKIIVLESKWIPPSDIDISHIVISRSDKSQKRTSISPRLRFIVFSRDDFRCRLCGRNAHQNHITLEVDHIIPLSEGGITDIENLQTLCRDCNNGKSDDRYDQLELLR